MTIELFVKMGVLASLAGTMLGGIVALFSKKESLQRLAQIVMMVALGLGVAATGTFLVKGLTPMNVFDSNYFFPGNLVMDQLSAIFLFLVDAVGMMAVLYGVKYILNEKGHYNISFIQFFTALFILGMQMVVLATTPIFFLFSWEIMSFASFLLVMSDWKIGSVRPALFYLVMTHLGAGAILAGFLFLSGGAVNLNFSQLALQAVNLPTATVIVAFLLFFFGFGSKAGLFPFHGWLPEAHPQAPSHISALMSGIMLKIAVYGMLRVLLFMLPGLPMEMGIAVVVIGLFSAVFGVLYSLMETDIKRILAFSSIENLGLIFTMIGIYMVSSSLHMTVLANVVLLAALFQSISHAFFKSGLFLTAGVAVQAFHTRNIEKMGGIAKRMKLFSMAALLLTVTAAALPPSGAFVGEWLLIQSIINNIGGAVFPAKVVLLVTLICVGLVAGLAVFSMVRFFGIGFLAEPRSSKNKLDEPLAEDMMLPVMVMGIVVFFLGAVAHPLLNTLAKGVIPGAEKVDFSPFTFNPLMLAALILAMILLTWLFRRRTSDVSNEREYHTWDCGQPIDSSMEYTSTAFSAPIRFFFRSVLQAKKKITAKPIVETNVWLAQKSIHVETQPIWDKYFYEPVVNLVAFLSARIRKLQNGNIQFYISLILISLIITAIVTL